MQARKAANSVREGSRGSSFAGVGKAAACAVLVFAGTVACTDGGPRAGVAWFVREAPSSLTAVTLRATGPAGERSFDVRVPQSLTEQDQEGGVTLHVAAASLSSDGKYVLARLEVTNDLAVQAAAIFWTSTQIFDLVGGRVGTISSERFTAFTMRGDAVVYEDEAGALSFVGIGADLVWQRGDEGGAVRAEKITSEEGWGWWGSAPGSAIVFAYDVAADAIRVFDYSKLGAGIVSELPGALAAHASPGPGGIQECHGMSAAQDCFDQPFITNADATLFLRRRSAGVLEFWDREQGETFEPRGFPEALDAEWTLVSGLGASSVLLWSAEDEEFARWNLRSNRVAKFPALGTGPWTGAWLDDGRAFAVVARSGALVRFLEDEVEVISAAQIGCDSLLGDTLVFGPTGARAAWSCGFGQLSENGSAFGTLVRVGPGGLSSTTGTTMLPVAIDEDGDVVAYSAANLNAAEVSDFMVPRTLYGLDADDELRRMSSLEPAPLLVRRAGFLGNDGSMAYIFAAPR